MNGIWSRAFVDAAQFTAAAIELTAQELQALEVRIGKVRLTVSASDRVAIGVQPKLKFDSALKRGRFR